MTAEGKVAGVAISSVRSTAKITASLRTVPSGLDAMSRTLSQAMRWKIRFCRLISLNPKHPQTPTENPQNHPCQNALASPNYAIKRYRKIEFPIIKAMSSKTPLIHITDLFHPPADPDDHVDLATLYALDDYDVLGVILDDSRVGAAENEAKRDGIEPGLVPMAQMNWLAGKAIPFATGPSSPLRAEDDSLQDCTRQENAGIDLLLHSLRQSHEPVFISCVGSCRVLAAALNREPSLVKEKTRAVLLNAGSVEGSEASSDEYNVRVDPHAWRRIGQGELPLWWYPCSARPGEHKSGQEDLDRHATFWTISHQQLFKDLDVRLQKWFFHGFSGNLRGDLLRSLHDNNQWGSWWGVVKQATRQMWSTASLVQAAGRDLCATPEGWRFLPFAERLERKDSILALDSVQIEMNSDGIIHWEKSETGKHCIFRRENLQEHSLAMGEALVALLRKFPL